MRFESFRCKGLGTFPEEVFVDFSKIDGLLVALVGDNGSGKTTIGELLTGGALYRQCATRGSIVSLATARDSFLEVGVTNGASYTIRHLADVISGKSEALVTDAQGKSVLKTTSVREFDAWSAAHMPPESVLYSSTVAVQGSGGFLDLKPGDRKGALLRVLGTEHLEHLAEKSREKRKEAAQALAVVLGRLADERRRSGDHKALLVMAESAKTEVAVAERDLETAQTALAAIQGNGNARKEAQRAYEAACAKKADLGGRLVALIPKQEDLELRLKNNRKVLTQSSEIRTATARVVVLVEMASKLELRVHDLKNAAAQFSKSVLAVRSRIDGFRAQALSAMKRADAARARLNRRQEIELAVAAVPIAQAQFDLGKTHLDSLQATVAELQSFATQASHVRIEGLRGTLVGIRDEKAGGPSAKNLAEMGLLADDELGAKAADAPKALSEAQAEVWTQTKHLEVLTKTLRDQELIAARAEDLKAAEADLELATHEVEASESARLLAVEEEASLTKANAEDAKALPIAIESLATLREEEATVAKIAKLATALAQAEARIAEIEPQLEGIASDRQALLAELKTVILPAAPTATDPKPAEEAVVAQQERLRQAHAMAAAADAAHAQAVEAAVRISALETEQRSLEADVADWQKLADDLGRDGIQALEIDAAGPELSALANDLLHSCFGPRFSLTIESSRLDSKGKREIEGCEVHVLDTGTETVAGREGAAETFSGGERVILGEALSLSLAMLSCRRSGVEGPTLVRDESGAALDDDRAVAYITMLRRAAAIVGASRVLFVAHNKALHALADARIRISDGRIEVEQ